MINKSLFSSDKSDWETPQTLFNLYHGIHKFDIDVCANNLNYKMKPYWTEKDNALTKSWKGLNCWMNPPYGRTITPIWISKVFSEIVGTNNLPTLICALLPARTDTKWFHNYIWNEELCVPYNWINRIEFLSGRIKFVGAKHSAPFPSMVVIFNNSKLIEAREAIVAYNKPRAVNYSKRKYEL